jgi:hypothetical protein
MRATDGSWACRCARAIPPAFRSPSTGSKPCRDGQLASARAGWWNGVNVLVHDPLDRLPRRFPPTLRDRSLFFNDHEVHSARYADYAVGALKLLDASLEGDEARAGDLVTRIRKRVSSEPSPHRGEHATANVHSEDLPAFRLCTET